MNKSNKNKIMQYYLNHILNVSRARFVLYMLSFLLLIPLVIQFTLSHLFGLDSLWESINIVNALLIGFTISLVAVTLNLFAIKELQRSRGHLTEALMKLKHAHNRDVELTIRMKKNIQALNSEVEAHQKTENELRRHATLLNHYVNLSPDLIFLRNEKNEFTWCNDATAQLFGKSVDEIIGLTPNTLFPPEILKKTLVSDENVLRYNTTVTLELWLTYPNGHSAFFEIKKMPFYDEATGKKQGLIGFARDVTEHKKNKNHLEKENREKMAFISIVSHEVRTALNAIVGLSQMLLDTELEPKQKEYQETIYASAIMLNVIINDVIELNRLELNKIKIERKPVEKNYFIANLKNITHTMVKPKNLALSLIVDDSCPNCLLIDETRFNQILWNIIHNAVKFTEKGGIALHTWYDKKRSMLYFSITDTGIGIPKKELAKIFVMYYRVKNNQSSPGTGIGLAISKAIAKQMGGDILVDSDINKGSCFTISIYAPESESCSEPVQPDEVKTVLSILLVEDIELNVLVAKSILEKLGNTIHVARTGQEALTMFKPNLYDLILLDIQLPDISGLDVARRLHDTHEKKALPPIIAFTANAQRNKEMYFDAGIDDIMNKPLSVTTFVAMVNRLLPQMSHSTHIIDDPFLSLHIFLVEDVELNIIVARSLLEKLGHTIDTAKTGEEALAKFKPNVYDLMLIDIRLPDISGLDISRQLRKHYSAKELPKLVAFTANSDQDKQQYFDAGMDDVLAKPLSKESFNMVVNRFWSSSEQTIKNKANSIDNSILNKESLQQYMELVGADTLLESTAMFAQVMPTYVEALDRFLDSNNKEGITEEAHKIKGAAGSLGLQHIQQVAQQLQNSSLPAWQDNIGLWVDEIKDHWLADLTELENWIKNYPEDDEV